MKLLVLGASGGVGRQVVLGATARGHVVTAQTRDGARLAGLPGTVRVVAADPRDRSALASLVAGQDAVVFALGESSSGPTTLFSDVTAALLPAMAEAGVRRLVAITGVGAGETRGHGGFFYDRVVFPLFTRHRYVDKDRQEALIRASALDWVIVRPAPFATSVPKTPLQVVADVRPETRLTRIARQEVAAFVLDQLGDTRWLRRAVFIGHA